jgi:hypothetical protein
MQTIQLDVAIDPGLIRAKAYEIWQSQGCPEGTAERNWFDAERQLTSRPTAALRENPSSPSQPPSASSSEPPRSSPAQPKPKQAVPSPRRTTRR